MANKSDIIAKDLIESYKTLQSTRKVAKKHNISQTTVRRKLSNLGIINKPIVFSCNDNFFSTDTAASLYWAGFLAADGCVQTKGTSRMVRLLLARRDREHVKKFKAAVNFTGTMHEYEIKNTLSSAVTIYSKNMFEDLKRFNIVPRKTLKYTFPEYLLSSPLVNHFMRGYFDGDGCVSAANGKTPNSLKNARFNLVGTEKFLYDYKNILESCCCISNISKDSTTRIRKENNSSVYGLTYSGNNIFKKIREFLYYDSDINTRLDRKYEKSFSVAI